MANIRTSNAIEDQSTLEESLGDKEPTPEEQEQMQNLFYEIRSEKLIAIVFAVMCLENFIYRYAMEYMDHQYFIKHIDKLSIQSKWIVVTKLAIGKDIDSKDQRFNHFNELILTRNDITHIKGEYIENPTEKQFEKFARKGLEKEKTFEKIALRSTKTVEEAISLITDLDESGSWKSITRTMWGDES